MADQKARRALVIHLNTERGYSADIRTYAGRLVGWVYPDGNGQWNGRYIGSNGECADHAYVGRFDDEPSAVRWVAGVHFGEAPFDATPPAASVTLATGAVSHAITVRGTNVVSLARAGYRPIARYPFGADEYGIGTLMYCLTSALDIPALTVRMVIGEARENGRSELLSPRPGVSRVLTYDNVTDDDAVYSGGAFWVMQR